MKLEAAEAFHTHLDRCRRCATSPFDLCDDGRRLLEATGRHTISLDELERVLGQTDSAGRNRNTGDTEG